MKKILCTILIIIIILTACSNKKATESTTTLKTFDEVYTNDIEVAIDYFNSNSNEFSSNELKCDFYSDILNELTIMKEKLIVPTSKDSTTRYYNFDTNEFNINYFDDNEDYKNIQSNKYFTLALNNDTFSIIVSEKIYAKLKDGLNYYIQNKRDKELPDSYPYIPKFIPVFEFENENIDFKTGMSNYNTVLVHNPTELSKLKDMNGLLPVKFVEHDIIIKNDAFYYQDDLVKDVIPDEINLSRFENETLYSVDEQLDIDYSKYSLVIIPAQTSINEDKLTKRTVKLADVDTSFPLKFAVLGEIKKLEFETYENVLNEDEVPKTLVIDETIKDTLVNVVSYLPTDFSVVSVTATLLNDTTVTFSLDDLRDPESHSIILFE